MKSVVQSATGQRKLHVFAAFLLVCIAAFLITRPIGGTTYFDSLRAGTDKQVPDDNSISNKPVSSEDHGSDVGYEGGVKNGELQSGADSKEEAKHKQGVAIINGTEIKHGADMKYEAEFGNMPATAASTLTGASLRIKPPGFKIVGLVFYGRRVFVDVLDCYLRKNLVDNGGYLDEVVFLERTDVREDQEYLATLVDSVPLYKSVKIGGNGADFGEMWSYATDNETMYLKIDDDIVFMSENAVPEMVHTLLDHPEAHDVAGNYVNSDFTNWLHYHGGAIYPYLPEIAPPPPKNESAWRPSELPTFPEEHTPEKYQFPTWWRPRPKGGFAIGDHGGPPFEGHRWLPLKNDAASLMKTPIEQAEFKLRGNGLTSWAIAAQQQYSLFQNIEQGTLEKYHFGTKDGVWNQQFKYYNINFLAIWGKSINEMPPTAYMDEFELSEQFPLALKKPLLIQSRAIVAHFNFGPQPEVKHTDLLSRYRAYANEAVCTPDNQKKELAY